MTVREAVPEDHPTYVRLHPELGITEPPEDSARFARLLPNVLIAEVDGVAAGFVRYLPLTPVGWIGALVTAPHLRRRGVGTALMLEAGRRMRRAGADRWRLSVKVDNVDGIALYERLGFERGARAQVMRLPRLAAVAAVLAPDLRGAPLSPEAAPELERRFGLPVNGLASGTNLALLDAGAIVGVARVMREVPSARYFAVEVPKHAESLLALVMREVGEHPSNTLLIVTQQPEVARWLQARGAALYLDTYNMEGRIPE